MWYSVSDRREYLLLPKHSLGSGLNNMQNEWTKESQPSLLGLWSFTSESSFFSIRSVFPRVIVIDVANLN